MSQTKRMMVVMAVVVLIIILILVWHRSSDDKVVVKSGEKKVKSKPFKLMPPTDISATNDNGTVTMTWTEAKGAKSYILYYSDTPRVEPETARTIGSISGNEFVISKVPAGTYYCRMTSLNGAKESEMSPLLTFTVEICTPSPAPQDFTFKVLSVDATKGIRILLSWKPDPTLDGYVIRLNYETPPTGSSGDHQVTRIEDPITANHILEDLDSNVKWFATISSFGAHCGEGLASEPLQLV